MPNKNIHNLNNLNIQQFRKEFSKPILFNFMLKLQAFHFVECVQHMGWAHYEVVCNIFVFAT